jgi:hypothetical protein
MLGFGVMSSFDWWWILAVFGVISYGFISAFGFLGVFRTLFAISNLLPIPIKIDPYHPDGNGGLGFIGSFLTETAVLFASGSVFIPILFKIYEAEGGLGGVNVLILILGCVCKVALTRLSERASSRSGAGPW